MFFFFFLNGKCRVYIYLTLKHGALMAHGQSDSGNVRLHARKSKISQILTGNHADRSDL
jgi:hypothetical protein